MPTLSFATVTATRGMPTTSALKLVPIPRMPAAARLPVPSGSRASKAANSCPPNHSVAASSQPLSGHAATTNTGSASTTRIVPAIAGTSRLGTACGVIRRSAITRHRSSRPCRRRARRAGSRRSRRSEARSRPRRAAPPISAPTPIEAPVVPSRRPEAEARERPEEEVAAAAIRSGAYQSLCDSTNRINMRVRAPLRHNPL